VEEKVPIAVDHLCLPAESDPLGRVLEFGMNVTMQPETRLVLFYDLVKTFEAFVAPVGPVVDMARGGMGYYDVYLSGTLKAWFYPADYPLHFNITVLGRSAVVPARSFQT